MVAEIISKLFTVFVLRSGNVIRQEELRPATHIYTYRRSGLYSHHAASCPSGLPVLGLVLTFTGSPIHRSSTSSSRTLNARNCDVLGIYVGGGIVIHFTRTGVENTSLDSFQQEGEKFHSLHSYAYGRPLLEYWLTRPGTCTTLLDTKSPKEVISKAWELHKGDSFGEYNLFHNNCEHFATFCKTGVRVSAQTILIDAFELRVKAVKDWAIKILQGIELE